MEYEGRTEQEAVEKAAADLGSESFDVEIIEKSIGIFGRGKVRIRVKSLDNIPDPLDPGTNSDNTNGKKTRKKNSRKKTTMTNGVTDTNAETQKKQVQAPSDTTIQKVEDFIGTITEKMGFPGELSFTEQSENKLIFELVTDHSSILIGKKGRNLDALQFLANVYLYTISDDETPLSVYLDSQGYRSRREEALIRIANRAADSAARNNTSRLLEPMNPFERRLIHRTINGRNDVTTRSEGEGLYKRVRISAHGINSNNTRHDR